MTWIRFGRKRYSMHLPWHLVKVCESVWDLNRALSEYKFRVLQLYQLSWLISYPLNIGLHDHILPLVLYWYETVYCLREEHNQGICKEGAEVNIWTWDEGTKVRKLHNEELKNSTPHQALLERGGVRHVVRNTYEIFIQNFSRKTQAHINRYY